MGKAGPCLTSLPFSHPILMAAVPRWHCLAILCVFFLFAFFFFLMFIGSVQSLKKHYILPYGRKACFLGTMAWWWDWLFLHVFGASCIEWLCSFWLSVFHNALLSPNPFLPLHIFSSLTFEYSSSIAGNKKLIARCCCTWIDNISWSILLTTWYLSLQL